MYQEVSVDIHVITVHMCCHIQRLEHCFSILVENKYSYATVIDIYCTEPEASRMSLVLTAKRTSGMCSCHSKMIFHGNLLLSQR